jgi:hypothetical protein
LLDLDRHVFGRAVRSAQLLELTAVAHSRDIHLNLNTYTKRVNKLTDLLMSMRFDLAIALYRWEQQRFVVANDYLRRAGLSGLDAVIAAWQSTSLGD